MQLPTWCSQDLSAPSILLLAPLILLLAPLILLLAPLILLLAPLILLLAHRSIRHHGPDTWNSVPDHLKLCVSVFSFKSFMKKHLLTKYNKWFFILYFKIIYWSLQILVTLPFIYLFPFYQSWLYLFTRDQTYSTLAKHMHLHMHTLPIPSPPPPMF